jgi:hypothetical protein
VRFVDAQVVDPGGLERDPWVFGGVELGGQALFGSQQRAFEPLDGEPVPGFGGLDPGPDLGELAVHVGLLLAGGQRDPLERRAGHHDAVPVPGGAAGNEPAALVGLHVLAARDEDPGLRVGLQPLTSELLQHVVGHHDGGFADQAKALQVRYGAS